MLEIAAKAADGLEIGGHLYGYTYPSTADVVVTNVYPMGPNGKRHPCLTEWDQDELRRLRQDARGDSRWDVGDFHTHPVRAAEPSYGDAAGQRQFRAECGWNDKHYPDVMVIIGVPPGGAPQEVGAWFFGKTERIKLEIKVASPDWNPVDEHGNWIQDKAAGAQ